MNLQVRITNREDCYIALPRDLLKHASQSYAEGRLATVVQALGGENLRYFFGCCGDVCVDHTIEIGFRFASTLKIENGDYLSVSLYPSCTFQSKVDLYVQEWADYAIVQNCRQELEGAILNNIQILFRGIVFPIRYSEAQFVSFYFMDQIDCFAIAQEAELNIMILPEKLEEQKAALLHLEVEIDDENSLDSYVEINAELHHSNSLNFIHQLIYMNHYPSFCQKFPKFLKRQKKLNNQTQKQQAKIVSLTKVLPNNRLPKHLCLVPKAYAKSLQLKRGQFITLNTQKHDISKEAHYRLFTRNQLIHFKNLRLIVHSELPFSAEDFIRELIQVMEGSHLVNLVNRVHNFKAFQPADAGTPFYLQLMQSSANNNHPDHELLSIFLLKEQHEPRHIQENERQLLTQFLEKSIQCVKMKVEIQKKVRFPSYQRCFKKKKERDTNMFRLIFKDQLKKLEDYLESENPRVLVTFQQNCDIHYLKYVLQDSYTTLVLDVDDLNMARENASLEAAKKFVKHLFMQINLETVVLVRNTESIKNAELIDFQQTYQILISNVLSKTLRRLILRNRAVKVVFLSDTVDNLSQNLKFLKEQTIHFAKPKQEQRRAILSSFFEIDLFKQKARELSQATENFSHREFRTLRKRLQMEQQFGNRITEKLVEEHIGLLQPNRSQASSKEKVPKFRDIAGLRAQKTTVLDMFDLPMKFEFLFASTRIKLPKSVLLYGMPGSGKTYFAQAICNELNINVIQVKGPELLNKYIGASEQNVRDLFQRAQEQSPCIIFLDEIDSVVPVRTASHTGVTDRVVNQFLCYLDGVDEAMRGVFIIAASSRPDLIDPALLRPGRIDKHIRIDYPSEEEIEEIMQIYRGPIQLEGVSKQEVVRGLSGLSQADVVSFFKETRIQLADKVLKLKDFNLKAAPQQHMQMEFVLDKSTLEEILGKMRASLDSKRQAFYAKKYEEFEKGGPRGMSEQKQAQK